MDVAPLSVAAGWSLAGWLVAVPLVLVATWRADWSRFRESEPVNVFLGAVASLIVLWNVRAEVGDAVVLHLLGTAILTLGAGVSRALVGGALVVAAVTLLRDAPLANVAWVWLTLVAVPAGTISAVLALVQRLPPNFFVYVFVGAFAGGAASVIAAAAAVAGYVVAAAPVQGEVVLRDFVPVVLSLAFAEATLTGMLVTLAVVYRPAWIATFDDERYLHRR